MSSREEQTGVWKAETPSSTAPRASELPSIATRSDAAGSTRRPAPEDRPSTSIPVHRPEAAQRSTPPHRPASPQAQAQGQGQRKRPGLRRVKRVVRHIDPVSVLRLSLFYSVCFLVIWLIVVAGIYSFLKSRGLFVALQDLSEGLALEWGVKDITLFWVERWAFLIGLTVGVLGSLMSVAVVFLYNLAADLLGGVEITHVERDM